MSELPTLVFVPGSWHKPTCYSKIAKLLEEQYNFRCSLVTLPSTSGNPDATYKDDIDAATAAIARETDRGRNVVVIAHSYGGMVGNSAIKGFTQRQASALTGSSASSATTTQGTPTNASATGYVIGLVLIASGFTLTGLAFMDPLFGIPPPSWRVNKETGFADLVTPPRELFYHDLPADEAEYWVSQLTSQSLKALFEGGEYSYAGWQDVPSWYIGTTEDRGLPVAMQRITVGMAREMGGLIEHRELESSHSPFLSQPNEVVGILTEAVEAFTGIPVEDTPDKGRQVNKILIPGVRIWRPLTWFRFGIPLFVGHILGRCYTIFGYCRKLWRAGLH